MVAREQGERIHKADLGMRAISSLGLGKTYIRACRKDSSKVVHDYLRDTLHSRRFIP